MQIVLIGMRAAGKSTVGRGLAAALQLPFVDTDDLIRQSAGMDIATIFAIEGEGGFRNRERVAVATALERELAVIALGGGAIMDRDNQAQIRLADHVIWLRANVETLLERMSDPGDRPRLTALSHADEVSHLLKLREPLYRAFATLTLDADDGAPEALVAQLVRRVGSA